MKRKPRRACEKAVALRYCEAEAAAPRVIAKGQGHIARKIRETALAQGIPVHRDDDLVELLAQVDIESELPPELYASVAEILAWIYRANAETRKGIVR